MRVPNQALRDRVTIEDYRGSGSMGSGFEAGRVVRATIQSTSKLITSDTGQVVTVVSVIIIRPEAGPVPVESRVTDSLGRKFRVVAADPYPDARRPSQWELLVSKWASPS